MIIKPTVSLFILALCSYVCFAQSYDLTERSIHESQTLEQRLASPASGHYLHARSHQAADKSLHAADIADVEAYKGADDKWKVDLGFVIWDTSKTEEMKDQAGKLLKAIRTHYDPKLLSRRELGQRLLHLGSTLKTLEQRVHLFRGLPAVQATVKLTSSIFQSGSLTTKPCTGKCIVSQTVDLTGDHKPGAVSIKSSLNVLNPPAASDAQVFFSDPNGWMVISDIDDTIKVTFTSHANGMIESTFLTNPPKFIPGMNDVYKGIKDNLGASFHYLSASPFYLRPFLRGFIQTNYPPGEITLRNDILEDPSGIEDFVKGSPKDFKVARMIELQQKFPHKKVICIGDTTYSDPEAYATIANKFEGWVKLIAIRKPRGKDQVATGIDRPMKALNSDERIEKAFAKLHGTGTKTITFGDGPNDPEAITEAISKLKTDASASH